MSETCAKCGNRVYPTESLRCLDQSWHKACFKCTECGMNLSMTNYKGFSRKPYCSAHYPKLTSTTVQSTPEDQLKSNNDLANVLCGAQNISRRQQRTPSVTSYEADRSSVTCDSPNFRPPGPSAAVASEVIDARVPAKELNILLLGETGVGKSTWINGLINYLTYDTLSEAQKGDLLCLIPISFTMTDENYKQLEIKWGEADTNERHKTGHSATQGAKTYTLRMADTVLRFIDTPGIGDTRGIDQDKKNMENIMSHLSSYKEIHGVCILLKPNNSRLTVMFEFCIKELLTNLHKDACRNMVICFTNARGTFYRPGDTFPALQTLLEGNNTVHIELSKETIYCMDNEAVRFLAAFKNGAQFAAKEFDNFESSWKASVDETRRLIEHITGLEPHKVDSTISLNSARRSILNLSKPIGEITQLIQTNIDVMNDKAKEKLTADMSMKELKGKLYVPAIDLEIIPLKEPCTVCTATSCTAQVSFGNITKTEYVKRCHPGCQLTGFDTDRINTPALQGCWAMEPSGGKTCRECGCSWNVHMHVKYETQRIKTNVIDEGVQSLINDKDSKIQVIEEHKKRLENKVRELEEEKNKIAKVSAEFACFLKANAIAPYNDALEAYLEHLIKMEENKIPVGGDPKTMEGLMKMRIAYLAEIEAIETAIKSNSSQYVALNPSDIQTRIERLFQLPFAGPQLKQMMSVSDSCSASTFALREKAVEVKTNSRLVRFGNWVKKKVR